MPLLESLVAAIKLFKPPFRQATTPPPALAPILKRLKVSQDAGPLAFKQSTPLILFAAPEKARVLGFVMLAAKTQYPLEFGVRPGIIFSLVNLMPILG